MPQFEPFPALRYSPSSGPLLDTTAPPYDVLSPADRDAYARRSPHNIVHIDCPLDADGPSRYDKAKAALDAWRESHVLTLDTMPSYTLYRMSFRDDTGRARHTVGVIGALEVVDVGAGGVLPHEQTTPKAKTDRLDLTRATLCNLSPVWGLSLAAGLSNVLEQPGEVLGSFIDEDGVEHAVERVADPVRVEAIRAAVSSSPVVIADGHHRYAISRTFRDELRESASPYAQAAGLTMTYVAELVEEQLSIAAIHRLAVNVDAQLMATVLEAFYDNVGDGFVTDRTLSMMNSQGAICLVKPDGSATLYREKAELFTGVRALDSARLEHAITQAGHSLESVGITYQHGVDEVLGELRNGAAKCAVLIRPVSLAEIRRTADEGLLMPPKSTFFTPKLRTGLVMRPLDAQ